MSFKLLKPYSSTQKADFIVEYNHKRGLKIMETPDVLYALTPDEIIQNDEVVINPEYKTKQQLANMYQSIAKIKQQLADTDYKIVKCSEASLIGAEMPYSVSELIAERQSKRNKINELECLISECQNSIKLPDSTP